MRDVLPELMRWWRAGEAVGVGTVVATFRSAPRPAGASMLVGPGGEAVGSVSGGCVEGAVYELGQEVVAVRRAGAAALRRLRRRRVRGRADLRRHPRRLRRDGVAGDLPRARARSPTTSRPGARWPSPRSSTTPTRRGSAVASSCGPSEGVPRLERLPTGSLGSAPRRRRGHRRRPRPAGLRAHRDADVRPRRRAPRRGDAGLRRLVRPPPADARLRRHRLRRGGRPRWAASSATG